MSVRGRLSSGKRGFRGREGLPAYRVSLRISILGAYKYSRKCKELLAGLL